jgi:hypothetical protein
MSVHETAELIGTNFMKKCKDAIIIPLIKYGKEI